MRFTVCLAAALLCAAASPAFATVAPTVAVAPADGGAVTIPWGFWLDAAVTAALAAVGGAAGVAAWLLRKVPAQFLWVIKALRLDQLLERAVQDGLNRVSGAARGQSLQLDTGLAVANTALRYAVEAAPQLVAEFGVLDLWKKILARIDFAAEVAVPPDVTPANLADPVFRRLVR